MKIYHFDIRNADKNLLDEWFEQMSSERRNAASEMKVAHKKNLCIAADALCRKAISDYCGISPAEIEFGYGAKGKPFAKNLPLFFNKSHSGDFAVCVVSDNEIGIDIEKIRDINLKVADRFATEKEKVYIRNSENGFFRIWTLKEAYFKCIGTGLGADIKDVSFEINGDSILCSKEGYEFSFIEIDKNYICSVCRKLS